MLDASDDKFQIGKPINKFNKLVKNKNYLKKC